MDAFSTSVDLLLSARDETAGAFEGLQRRIDGVREHLDRIKDFAIANVIGSLGTDAITGALGKIDEFGAGLIAINAETETLHQTLTALYQSSSSADQAFAYMTKFAQAAPFTKESIVQAGVAVAAFGGDITQVLPALGNVAAVMGTDMPTAAQALTDAVEGRFQMMQRDLHISKDSLVAYGLELNSQGQVMNNSLLPAFEKFAAARFPTGMSNQMQTFTGQVSNLTDQFQNFQRIMGGPIFEGVKAQLLDLLGYLNTHQTDVTNFAYTLGTVLGKGAALAFEALHTVIGALPVAVGLFTHLADAVRGPAAGAFAVIQTALAAFVGWLDTSAAPLIGGVIARITGWWQDHQADVASALATLRTGVQTAFSTMAGYAATFGNWLSSTAFPAVATALDTLAGFWHAHAGGVQTVLQTIGDNIGSFRDYATRQLMNVAQMVAGTMTAGWGLAEIIVGGAIDVLSGNMTQLQRDWDDGSNRVMKGFIQGLTGLLGFVGTWAVQLDSMMAQALVPVANDLLKPFTWFERKVYDVFVTVGGDAAAGIGAMIDAFAGLDAKIDPGFVKFLNFIQDKTAQMFTTIVQLAADWAGAIGNAFAALPDAIGRIFGTIGDKIGGLIGLMRKIPGMGGGLPSERDMLALGSATAGGNADPTAVGNAIGAQVTAYYQTHGIAPGQPAIGPKLPFIGPMPVQGPPVPPVFGPPVPAPPPFIGPPVPKIFGPPEPPPPPGRSPGQIFADTVNAWLAANAPGLKPGEAYTSGRTNAQAQQDIRAAAAAIVAPYMAQLQTQEQALLAAYVVPTTNEAPGGGEAGSGGVRGEAPPFDWKKWLHDLTTAPLSLKTAPPGEGSGSGPGAGGLKVPGFDTGVDAKTAAANAKAALATAEAQFSNDLKYQASITTLMADVRTIAQAQLAAHVSAGGIASTTKNNLDKVAGEVRALAVQDKTDGQSAATLLADIRNYQAALVAAGDKPSQVAALVAALQTTLGQAPAQLAKLALADARNTLKIDIADGAAYKQLLADAGVAIRDLKATGERGVALHAATIAVYAQVLAQTKAQFANDLKAGADVKTLQGDVAAVMHTEELMGKTAADIKASVAPLNASILKLNAGAGYTAAQQTLKVDLSNDASIQKIETDIATLATLDAARGSKPATVKLDSAADWSSLIGNLQTRLSTGEAGGSSIASLVSLAAQIKAEVLKSGAGAVTAAAVFNNAMQTLIAQAEGRVSMDIQTGAKAAKVQADIQAVLTAMADDGYAQTAIDTEHSKLLSQVNATTVAAAANADAQAKANAAAQEKNLLAMVDIDKQGKDWARMAGDIGALRAFLEGNKQVLGLSDATITDMVDKLAGAMTSGAKAQSDANAAAAKKAIDDAKAGAAATLKDLEARVANDKTAGDTAAMAGDIAAVRAFFDRGGAAALGMTPAEVIKEINTLSKGGAAAATPTLSATPVALLRTPAAFGDALAGAGSFMQTVASLASPSGGNTGTNAIIARLEAQNRQLELEVALLTRNNDQGLTLIQGIARVNQTLQGIGGTGGAAPPALPAGSVHSARLIG